MPSSSSADYGFTDGLMKNVTEKLWFFTKNDILEKSSTKFDCRRNWVFISTIKKEIFDGSVLVFFFKKIKMISSSSSADYGFTDGMMKNAREKYVNFDSP